jgi:hypothetical protein
VKAKEKAICEKAVQLWGQAIDEGYDETEDNSGITVDIFKGAHYAIGALKGFWTPSETGFSIINQAISDLEQLLSDDEVEELEDNGSAESAIKEVARPKPPSGEAIPDPRVRWRITRSDDGKDGYLYETVGVNGYTLRKYYEATQPGEQIEFDGENVLPSEIPIDSSFEDENISDALVIWVDSQFSFELVRDPFKPFEVDVEVDDDENEVLVWDISGVLPYVWQHYDLSELIDCINEVLNSWDNFRLVFIRQAA